MQKATQMVLMGLLIFLAGCQFKESGITPQSTLPTDLSLQQEIVPLDGKAPMTIGELERVMVDKWAEKGELKWEDFDAYVAWSALVRSDSMISVGYQPADYQNINETIHLIDVNNPEWKQVREDLIQFIVEETNKLNPENRVEALDILGFGEQELPFFFVRVYNYEILAKLREMKVVRYAEPSGYSPLAYQNNRSSSGCGLSNPTSQPPSSYYGTTTPSTTKISWNHLDNQYHHINNAWNNGADGDNITVGVIDTGISGSQSKLNGSYSSGSSTGRYREKFGTYKTGWWWWARLDGPDDKCGHGTSMAGVIAAPRAGGGASMGVAWKSNLISVRGTSDVIVNGSNEKNGVADALRLLGNRSDVKIISMSIGDVFSSGTVSDGIRYANNRGKLIFAAGGTSTSFTNWVGVIFPASMNETVAVTGVDTGTPLRRCDVCHSGNKIDFAVIMEDRNNSNKHPLTLAPSGNIPDLVGGSSVATATMAGMAALVWGENPSASKSTILQKLKEAGEFYPSRDGSFGWGRVDMNDALSGI
ncbi:MAG: S8/S53 family peptidase [Bacteroidota bacterium]